MVRYAITSRKREGLLYRWISEHGFDAWDVASAFTQFLACFSFYPWEPFIYCYATGCVIFFLCAFVGALLSFHALLESFYETRELSATQEGEKHQELLESCFFFSGNICFALGSLFFLPGIYDHDERNGVTLGTLTFFAGSVFFCLASFVNTVGMTDIGSFQNQDNDKKVALMSLAVTGAGGLAFAVGSIPYFPELDKASLDSCKGIQIELHWKPVIVGTHFYVLGAALFTCSALLSFIHGHMKNIAKPNTEGKEAEEPLRLVARLSRQSEIFDFQLENDRLKSQLASTSEEKIPAAERLAMISAQQVEIEKLQGRIIALESTEKTITNLFPKASFFPKTPNEPDPQESSSLRMASRIEEAEFTASASVDSHPLRLASKGEEDLLKMPRPPQTPIMPVTPAPKKEPHTPTTKNPPATPIGSASSDFDFVKSSDFAIERSRFLDDYG